MTAKPAKNPDPDLHAMTPGQRLDWIVGELASIRLELQRQSNQLAYHTGQIGQTGRNVDAIRGDLAKLLAPPPASHLRPKEPTHP